jgi:hypothetical protein
VSGTRAKFWRASRPPEHAWHPPEAAGRQARKHRRAEAVAGWLPGRSDLRGAAVATGAIVPAQRGEAAVLLVGPAAPLEV